MIKLLGNICDDEDFAEYQPTEKIYHIYLRYLKCVNKTMKILEQIQHPQKRKSVQCILEHAMGRILELKSEIVSRVFTECPNLSEELLKNGYTAEDQNIVVPFYFSVPGDAEAIEKRAGFDSVLSRYGATPDEMTPGDGTNLTLEDAVRIIQVHERARQGQARARLMREIKMKRDEAAAEATRASKRHYNIVATFVNKTKAATVIQKVWRGYKIRKYVREHRSDEYRILGMSDYGETASNVEIRRWKDRRKQTHADMIIEYENQIQLTRRKLEEQTDIYLEKMLDEKRDWYTSFLMNEGVLPEISFPDDEQNRSSPIEADEFTENAIGDDDMKLTKSKGKNNKKDDAKIKKGSLKKPDRPIFKLKKPGQKVEKSDVKAMLPKPKPSRFTLELQEQLKQFQEIWGTDLTEQINTEINVQEIEKVEKAVFEKLIKEEVDTLITQDIDTLKQAIDRDKGKKGKKTKPSKKLKRGNKKGKKEKDLTPDRTLESLVEELVHQEILKNYPTNDSIEEFVCDELGHHDFVSTSVIENPTFFDIRQSIKEYCILPLGSEIIRKKSPLIRSVLLLGPKGNGKKLLLKEVCRATGSVVFDLTATNITGKYQGKAGLNMLMHLVNKVSRLLQPAIIYVSEAEKTYIKKVLKSDRTDPRRLKKDLPKFVKGITCQDRIMLIGITDSPFESDLKSLCSTYQKIIYVPKPDYGHRKALWNDNINKNHGEVTADLDLSTLAKLSDGYSSQVICQVVKQVLTTRRVSQMARYPLTLTDFISSLNQFDPIYTKEEDLFQSWLCKTPLGKKRMKLLRKQNVEVNNEANMVDQF